MIPTASLRIGLAIPRPETQLSLAEIVADVEAGLKSATKLGKVHGEERIVVEQNGREYELRVYRRPHEQPRYVVDRIRTKP
jgi:hemin uptake protein HemP